MAGSDQAYVLIRALIARYQFVPPEEEEEVTGIQMSRRALSARCGCGCGWVWVYVGVCGWVGGWVPLGGWVGGWVYSAILQPDVLVFCCLESTVNQDGLCFTAISLVCLLKNCLIPSYQESLTIFILHVEATCFNIAQK